MGLSPRVRGSPLQAHTGQVTMRSIPACAGEPQRDRKERAFEEVYPRVCGGAAVWMMGLLVHGGLSPRVRGSPAGSWVDAAAVGSIPACAGEPITGSRSLGLDAVYPRVCGGASVSRGQRLRSSGLSPRVRGSRDRGHPTHRRQRSIPACAGEPRSSRMHRST